MFEVVLVIMTVIVLSECSHTLAVAEQNGSLMKFLQWYTKFGHAPNLSSIALSGLPQGRGQKGGRPVYLLQITILFAVDNQ